LTPQKKLFLPVLGQNKQSKRVQLLSVDHSARASMKNAASCENQCELQDTLIIDTSNAHAAPGPSRGYACLRVAFPSIGTHPLEGEIRGWGFAGDSTRLRPPKCRPGGRRSRARRWVTVRLFSPRVLEAGLPVDSFIWLPAVRGAGAVRPGAGCGARRPTDDGAPGTLWSTARLLIAGGRRGRSGER